MTHTELMIKAWKMGRSRLTCLFPRIEEKDMPRRLHPKSNSLGFLLHHIAEVEMLLAKNLFGLPVEVKTVTVGPLVRDTGEFTDLGEQLQLLEKSASLLEEAFSRQEDGEWETLVSTPEFGTITKAEALARITTHTAYHAGQIGLILKYGS
jgi:uncharacterized damage-inducible protein DinB